MKKYEVISDGKKIKVISTIEQSYDKDYYEKFMEHAESYLKSYKLYNEDLYDSYNYTEAANDFVLAHILLKEHEVYHQKATTRKFSEHLNALSDDAGYWRDSNFVKARKEKGCVRCDD